MQVITKINGKSKLVKTIGSSSDSFIVPDLGRQGHQFIVSYCGQQTLDFLDELQRGGYEFIFGARIKNEISKADLKI